MSVKKKVIPFIPKQIFHPSDIYLHRNKALSDIIDTELYSVITNVYKPPKILCSQKLSGSLGLSSLKSFHGFVFLGGKMFPIAFLAFNLAMKLWEILVWKIFSKHHIEHVQRQ